MILSGNRMPIILTIFSLFLLIIFEQKARKYFLTCIIIFILLMITFIRTNIEIKQNYFSFFTQAYKVLVVPFSSNFKNKSKPPYFDEFESFYDTWQLNKYIGGGVRSFRIYCPYRKNIDDNERSTCNTHPHNYYLEILAELGLIGFAIFLILFYKILKLSFNKILSSKNKSYEKYPFLIFFILFIVEVFPLKNTGSFFSTWNATFIFILISCLIGFLPTKQNLSK